MDKNITTPVEGTFMRVDGVTDNSEVAANTIIGRTRRPFNFGTVDIRVDESGVLTWLALNRTQVDENEEIATLSPQAITPSQPASAAPIV